MMVIFCLNVYNICFVEIKFESAMDSFFIFIVSGQIANVLEWNGIDVWHCTQIDLGRLTYEIKAN
jgi:hypothetical protein